MLDFPLGSPYGPGQLQGTGSGAWLEGVILQFQLPYVVKWLGDAFEPALYRFGGDDYEGSEEGSSSPEEGGGPAPSSLISRKT